MVALGEAQKMKWTVYAWVCALLLIQSTGCAYYIQTGHERVLLRSNPSSYVYVDGGLKGRSPVSMRLKRGENHHVVFHLEGYEPLAETIESRTSGAGVAWFVVGFLLWGPFELIDFTNGSVYELEPVDVHTTLIPIGHSPLFPAPSVPQTTQPGPDF